MDSLFTFLLEEGVDPTNNFGERMLCFAVLWRKRSQGTSSEKGNRWVERIASLRQTCRLQGKSSFAVLVEAMDSYFKEQKTCPGLDQVGGMKGSPPCDHLRFFLYFKTCFLFDPVFCRFLLTIKIKAGPKNVPAFFL